MGLRRKRPELDLARVLVRLPSAFAHIGVYDVKNKKAYAAREGLGRAAIELNHAELFSGQAIAARAGEAAVVVGVVVKDRFVCFWFHPPHTREGPLMGYPVDWSEHNLLVRLEPQWSYTRQVLLPAHHSAAIDANIGQQLAVAAHLLGLYRAHGLGAALNVHMIGPRAKDSLFYAHRWEPKY